MADIQIDAHLFYSRLHALASAFDDRTDESASLDATPSIVLVAGASDEDNPYRKTTALQTWLLGYEFPSTLTLITRDTIYFVMSAGKSKYLEPLKAQVPSDGKSYPSIEILGRTKDAEHNKSIFDQIVKVIADKSPARVAGHIAKDAFEGKFVDEWKAFIAQLPADQAPAFKDCASPIAAILAVKDANELSKQLCASEMSSKIMAKFVDDMANIVENEKKITHEKLAQQIDSCLENQAIWKSFKPSDGQKLERALADWCYSPIIQSGGNYDLKSSAQSDEERLKAGVILCSIGIRYKSYCSNVGRTYLVDPDKAQESNYLFLVELQKHIFAQMSDGASMKDVYSSAQQKVKSEKPELEPYFVKTLGFPIGIEFRESSMIIGPKCARPVRNGMIFCLSVGFQGIPNSKDPKKTYALLLLDTIQVTSNGVKILSTAPKQKDDVMFYFDEPSKPAKANGKNGKASPRKSRGATANTAILKTKTRGDTRGTDNDSLQRRLAHQKELLAARNKTGLERYAGESGKVGEERKKEWKRFESYARDTQLPERVKDLKLLVDHRRNSIICPINGYAVPFHVSTLKSVIKQEEGDYIVIRLMLNTPGQIAGKKEDTPFQDPNATFIRGITYRSLDKVRFTELYKEISELRKAATKRESEKREFADVVEQDNLTEVKRPHRLQDVQLRPQFEGKRSAGDVEIHQNGIRWSSNARSDHKVDILYNNVKHLLFQPCDNELIVLIHVHLKNPIIIGKKKAKDITFYREASDIAFDETGNKKKRRRYDEDEIEDEQEELRHRARLNKEFKNFADKIADSSNNRFDVDIPFRELGFQGVPFRSGVLLQPTTDCLIYLAEPPCLVITLADVEVVHLERVQYGLTSFDMVFVMQDLKRTPIHINTVPSGQLENVKEWLDGIDLPFTEGPVNLNWPQIMKTVTEDPYEFFKEGGWDFLGAGEAGGSDEEGSSDASDAFQPSSEEDDESSAFSDGDSGSDAAGSEPSGSDFDDDDDDD